MPPNYELAAERAAKKYGVDPKIFKAMIRQESGFKMGLTSGAGAKGIAQFIDSTAKAYGVNTRDNRATDDLEGAARYLKDNLERTGGNYQRALSIYNSGRPDTFRDPNFAQGQTYNYVRKIMAGSKGEDTQESGGSPSSGEPSRSREVRTSRTIPGEDNSDLRKQVVLRWLQERERPGALADLASGLKEAQDVPAAKAYTRKTVTDDGAPAASKSNVEYPLGKRGKVIGTPHAGTHTLGNWQSDEAVDVAVPRGTPIYAHTSGTISKVREKPDGGGRFAGSSITLDRGDNAYFYAHLSRVKVKAGQRVRKGQLIGYTGSANGVEHLHYGQQHGDPRQRFG